MSHPIQRAADASLNAPRRLRKPLDAHDKYLVYRQLQSGLH